MTTTVLRTVYPIERFNSEVDGAPIIQRLGVTVDDSLVSAVLAAAAVSGVGIETGGLADAPAAPYFILEPNIQTMYPGPPIEGTFQRGQYALDSDNVTRVCIVSGTPGTWALSEQAAYDTKVDQPTAPLDGKVLAWNNSTKQAVDGTSAVLADVATVGYATTAAVAAAGYAVSLIPTAVKTSAYTAATNDLVPVDTTSGAVTITLPSAPADKTRIAVKHVIQGGTNAVTVARGGSDVFNKTGGSTSLTLPYLNQALTLQYRASGGIWYVLSDDLTPSAVSTLVAASYVGKSSVPLNPADYGVTFDGTTDDRAALNTFFSTNVAAGDVVQFPRNKTAFVSSQVSVGSTLTGVTILGNGATLKLSASAASGTQVLSFSPNDGTVRGLIVDGQTAVNATGIRPKGSRQVIEGCTLKACVAGGVYVESAQTDLLISGNRFTGGGYGVLFANTSTATRVSISRNVFVGGSSGDAIEVNTPQGGVTEVNITDNIISGYTNTSASGMGVGLAKVTGGVIANNDISGCGLDGIHVEDDSSGLTISGNRVYNCVRSGVSLQIGAGTGSAPRSIGITGNAISTCGTGNGLAGIAFEGATAISYCNVSNNTVRGCGRAGSTNYGIFFGSGGVGNICVGNTVSNTIGSTGYGIGVSGQSDASFAFNRCFDDQGTKTQHYAMRVLGVTTNVLLIGNHIAGNATGLIDEGSISGGSSGYIKRYNRSGGDNFVLTPTLTPGGGTNVSDATFGTVVPNNGAVVLDGSNNRLDAKIANVWYSVPLAVTTGTASLVAGTVTVANASITANSQIRVWSKALGGTPGALYVSAKTAGTGFTIVSTSGSDTSGIVYEILAY